MRWDDVPQGPPRCSRRSASALRRGVPRRTLDARRAAARAPRTPPMRSSPTPEPPYGQSLAIFRHDVVQASIWASPPRAHRARRGDADRTPPAADREIGGRDRGGRLRARAEPGLHDEIGDLALTIDRMRKRLGDAFEQLSAERDRLERVLEQMKEGVLAVDRELRVEFANANAKLLLDGVPLERARRCRRPTAACRCAASPRGSSCPARRSRRPGASGGRRDDLARRRARVVVGPRRARLRRHHRAGAPAPGRARVRHERLARAADPGDGDHERGRGAPVRRAGHPRRGSASST